ncbi:hypothetical protein ACL9RI_25400 [Janthinobacterium sp. Mn2066]|uniref:hypothetical protein n=1 Tax=Janthinobacterium sp. Mn2066 TaxID=3395264 RepID=UPI003BD27231
MKTADIQNLALGVAALGLVYAMYKVFSKGGSKPSGKAPVVPSQTGTIVWTDGIPNYQSFAPYDSNSALGQLGIDKLLNGGVGDPGSVRYF